MEPALRHRCGFFPFIDWFVFLTLRAVFHMRNTEDAPPGVSTRRRTRRTRSIGKENSCGKTSQDIALVADDQSTKSFSQNELLKDDSGKLLLRFHSAAEDSCFRDYWEQETSLAKAVVHASWSLSLGRTIDGLILLDSKSTELLNMSRKLIKEATEAKKSNRVVGNLYVATHLLRAVGPRLTDVSKQEAAIKVLYHAIHTAEALGNLSKESSVIVGESFVCVFAAYEVLGHLLQQVCVQSDNGISIGFTFQRSENKAHFRSFPVPEKSRRSKLKVKLTLREISSIAIQATIFVSRVLRKLSFEKDNDIDLAFQAWGRLTVGQIQSGEKRLRADIIKLFQNIATRWIFAVGLYSVGYETEMLSHCKKAHLVLWDAAMMISENKDDANECLELRKHAIRVLLLNGRLRELPQRVGKYFITTVFDSACSYAWKSAVSYATKLSMSSFPVASGHPLHDFYMEASSILDTIASIESAVYGEYCAYRAIHIGQFPVKPSIECGDSCLFTILCYPCFHDTTFCSSESNDCPVTIWMALFFLALRVKSELEAMKATEDLTLTDAFYKGAGTVLEIFESTISVGLASVFVFPHQIWLKLFSMVGLHKAVHALLDRSEGICLHSSFRLLRLASDILVKCLGPLCHLVVRMDTVDESLRSRLWEFMLECYIRGIWILESLCLSSNMIQQVEPNILEHSDTLILSLVERLSDTNRRIKPPSSCIYKFASSLKVFGRKRFEVDKDAAIPVLLASIELKMLQWHSKDSTCDKLLLSSTWSFLASIYKSLNRNDEAIVATASALLFEILQRAENCSMPGNQLVEEAAIELAHLTGGVLSASLDSGLTLSEEGKALAARLAVMLSERTNSKTATKVGKPILAVSPETSLEMLKNAQQNEIAVEDSFIAVSKVPFTASAVMERIISGNANLFVTTTTRYCAVYLTLQVIAEVLSKIGAVIQMKAAERTTSGEHMLWEYGELASLAIKTGSELVADLDSPALPVISAILHLIASVSLVSCHQSFASGSAVSQPSKSKQNKDPELLLSSSRSHARIFAAQALESINTFENQVGEWAALSLVLLPSMTILWESMKDSSCGWHAAVLGGSESAYRMLIKATMVLKVCPNHSRVIEMARRCVLSTLSLVAASMALSGETLKASEIASWGLTLSIGQDPFAFAFLATECLTAQAETGILLNRKVFPETAVKMPGFALEKRACSARLDLTSIRKSKKELNSSRAMETMLSEVETALKNSSNMLSNHVLRWTRSTILLGLSEAAKFEGRVALSIKYLRECFQDCKQLTHTAARDSLGKRHSSSVPLQNEPFIRIFFIRCLDRQLECVIRLYWLYASLGEIQKASAYARTVLAMKTSFLPGNSFARDQSVNRLIVHAAVTGSHRAVAEQQVLQAFTDCEGTTKSMEGTSSLSLRIEKTLDALNVHELLDEIGFGFSCSEINDLQHVAAKRYTKIIRDPEIDQVIRSIGCERTEHEHLHPNIFCNLKLSLIRDLLVGGVFRTDLHRVNARDFAASILDCPGAPPDCLAHAHYFSGLVELDVARSSGALRTLWTGYSNFDPNSGGAEAYLEHLVRARNHFECALRYIGKRADLFSRRVLRSLALIAGPACSMSSIATSSHNYIVRSLGRSWRFHSSKFVPTDCKVDGGGCDSDSSQNAFKLFDSDKSVDVNSFYEELQEILPSSWNVISAVLCPSGEMLISTIQKAKSDELTIKAFCVFPEPESEKAQPLPLFDILLKPFDRIMQRNQDQLDGGSPGSKEFDLTEKERKKGWWKDREELDTDLLHLLQSVDRKTFGSDFIQSFFTNNRGNTSSYVGSLASRFDAVSDDKDQISAEAKKGVPFGMSTLNECTFLVLDENLQRFPFEGLPSFENTPVSRLPCISFLYFSLKATQRALDLQRVNYVVDPESNLPGTRQRIMPILDSLSQENDREWDGIVGCEPSSLFFQKSLSMDSSLFLYFGHGGAEKYFSSKEIFQFGVDKWKTNENIGASIVLMGCSSGRLSSANQKGTKHTDDIPFFFEPGGVAISYLAAGAPCVVGNLWDVTDRDIDRFSTDLIGTLFKGPGSPSLVSCVCSSRAACRMQHIVGCAPVCYGIPVPVLEHTDLRDHLR